ISHGWKGDMPAAREQYGRWIGAMAQCAGDIARMRQVRPGFLPLLIGLHWPSLPYGDESVGGGVSFGVAGGDPVEALIEQAAQEEAVSFGIFGLGGILSLLLQLSFWKMKDRARQFGETGGFDLLTTLQRTAAERDVRFHLMGHSLGCIVVSATVAGPGGKGT